MGKNVQQNEIGDTRERRKNTREQGGRKSSLREEIRGTTGVPRATEEEGERERKYVTPPNDPGANGARYAGGGRGGRREMEAE